MRLVVNAFTKVSASSNGQNMFIGNLYGIGELIITNPPKLFLPQDILRQAGCYLKEKNE